MATLANFFEVKWGRTAQRRVSPLKRRMRKARCYGGTFASWLERWEFSLDFFEVEVGTHRPDAFVSAVGMAERQSDVLRWDLCTVGGEVATLANFFGEVGAHRPKRVCLRCREG